MAISNSDPFADDDEAELDISPLIDVAFLLLIYFIVTTTLQAKEADLKLALPGIAPPPDQEEIKLEQLLVEIESSGNIIVNQEPSTDTDPDERELPDLLDRLKRYKRSAQIANTETQVVIKCADEAKGQRFIDVLNVCAKADIVNITLANPDN